MITAASGPERRQQFQMRIVPSVSEFDRRFPKRSGTISFHHRNKIPESSRQLRWKRMRKSVQLGLDATFPCPASLQFRGKFFLKARNRAIKAQDLRRKTILGAQLFSPCNSPIPLALSSRAIEDRAIRRIAFRTPAI